MLDSGGLEAIRKLASACIAKMIRFRRGHRGRDVSSVHRGDRELVDWTCSSMSSSISALLIGPLGFIRCAERSVVRLNDEPFVPGTHLQ